MSQDCNPNEIGQHCNNKMIMGHIRIKTVEASWPIACKLLAMRKMNVKNYILEKLWGDERVTKVHGPEIPKFLF